MPKSDESAVSSTENVKPVMQRINQWFKNSVRLALFPLTQPLMAVGIFPAQALSTLKKVPLLKSLIGLITRKLGNDSRSAAQTYTEDFLHQSSSQDKSGIWGRIHHWFNNNPKALPFATDNLHINALSRTPYTTDFGRKVFLETFSFQHKEFENLPPNEQYYRVHCSGNSGNCSRFFPELAQLSQQHKELKTMTYNHPGIEGSDGVTMSQDDLINALYAQVKVLLAGGAKPENIELTGFSIGAATAALTAKKLLDEGIAVNLFCDRTLSTMPDVVTDKLPILGTAFKALKIIPGIKELTHYVVQPSVKYLLIKPLLWLLNWDMDPASAYQEIDAHKKALTGVKPQSAGEDNSLSKRIGKYLGRHTGLFKTGNGDKTIAPHVSLLVGTENVRKKDEWKAKLNRLNDAQPGKEQDELVRELEMGADNAISVNAMQRLRLANQGHQESAAPADLINLAMTGNKARRLQGTTAADAHNVTADKIMSRKVKGGSEGALRAAGLPENSPKSLLTYYSLFHQAIKSHNQLQAECTPAAPAR